MMKCAFYFFLIALLVLKISVFCPDFFGYIWKRMEDKAKVNFKIYNIISWETTNTQYIAQYIKRQRQSDNEIWSVREYNMRNIFL